MPVRRARWLKPRSVSILLPLLTFAVLTAASRWPAGGRAAVSEIRFAPHTIDTGLTGGYQVVVADLDRDGRPDLIALADGLSEVRWYRNPGWERHLVVSGVVWPVNLAAADLDGDGIPELALTDRFDTKYDSSAGAVSILTHRGDPAEPWAAREIDRLPTSHRLRFADIDGSGSKVLIDAPLIGPGATEPEYRGRVPIALYAPPAWSRQVLTEEEEGVVHGMLPVVLDGDDRQSILTAGFSGVHALRFDGSRWTRTRLVAGDPSPWPKSGASEIAVGRLGREQFLATIEPWHGNKVVVYRRAGNGWRRHPIEESITDGHVLLTADFDGDGADELVAAERGGKRGVYLYRLADPAGDRWSRQTIDPAMGAAGCAVADLDADARPDLVCLGPANAELRWYRNVP